jgi:hypothetical protein
MEENVAMVKAERALMETDIENKSERLPEISMD